jgi:hypothetical protein
MIKKAFVFGTLMFCSVMMFGQNSPIPNNQWYDIKLFHFGYRLGLNVMNFTVKTNDDYQFGDTIYTIGTQERPGFSVGVIANMRLHNYLDLRFLPGISIGERMMNYSAKLHDLSPIETKNKKIESVYMDIPIEIKWKTARIKNYRAYVVGGFQYSIDFAANAKKKDSNADDVLVKLKYNDFSFYTGVGLSFYLPFSNIISVEFKMNFGVNDVLKKDGTPYTNSIEKLMSKNAMISLMFE